MPRNLIAVCLSLTCLAAAPLADVPQKRVSPDAYRRAPQKIRDELKRRNCELPSTQHWDNTLLNIVSGQFGDAKQQDWAALCIAPDGATRALVFWGGSAPCPAEIREGWALEDHFPPGQAGSLYLLAQSRAQIIEYRKSFGGDKTNPVTHQGVEVGGDKASIIYYCHRGKWLQLQGAD